MSNNRRNYNPKRDRTTQSQKYENKAEDQFDTFIEDELTEVVPDSEFIKEDKERNEDIINQLKQVVNSPNLKEQIDQFPNIFGQQTNLKQHDINSIAQKIEDEVQKNKVIYTVKKENGKVVFETEQPSVSELTIKGLSSKSLMIEQMIKDVDTEILKAEIEIEVHRILEQESKDQNETTMHLRRIESFHNNIEYLKKKRNVLMKL